MQEGREVQGKSNTRLILTIIYYLRLNSDTIYNLHRLSDLYEHKVAGNPATFAFYNPIFR